MDSYLLSQIFLISKSNPNVYIQRIHEPLLILFLYADSHLIRGSLVSTMVSIKDILHDRLSMTDMGPLKVFLGIDMNQDDSRIKLCQAKYTKDLLVKFHLRNYKFASTPFFSRVRLHDGEDTRLVENTKYTNLVGSLLYLTHSQPNFSHTIGVTHPYFFIFFIFNNF
jgi:hypothetical protein